MSAVGSDSSYALSSRIDVVMPDDGGSVEFRILGPLEITAGSERLELGGSRQQIVAAMLLMSANRVVTMDRLLEAIYGEDLPPTSRSQAQISISYLRRMFAAHSPDAVITTHPSGYIINVSPGELDLHRFEELVAAGRTARDAQSLKSAVASYRDALRLWRGAALDGIDSDLLRAAASRLDEQRITVNEDRIQLELELGRHRELVGELGELIHEYPLRERLRGQLMLALYRCDRMAEALQAYRDARQVMIDELGLEPSERLQRLERSILNADPSLNPPQETISVQPTRTRAPSLLPIDIADFTARSEQVAEIYRHLIRSEGEDPSQQAVPVVVIVGKGGVGKTSLAVHAAHGMARHFTDGQLFADLHGWAAHPVGPLQVLERFLRALGVSSSQIPEGLDERAEVYRSLLSERKMLIVLDDAASESNIRPLLPGSGGTVVLVTSRRRLPGIAGAVHVELEVFNSEKSLDLLASIIGAERVESQREMAVAVAERCGYLPLALRIAGARLHARPHWSIQQLADRLADDTHRLDELKHGDLGVRPSISLTYDSTSEEAKRLFRRLAVLDMPVFSVWLSAALLGQPIPYAEELLDDLVSSRLVEAAGDGTGINSHYRIHDLIRVFARERLVAEESVADRKAALERALGALLSLAESAYQRYYGGDYLGLPSDAIRWPLPETVTDQLVSDPLAWYDHERVVILSGVRQAAQTGLVKLGWTLAFKAIPLYESRAYFDDWQETHSIALAAAAKAQDVGAQAAMLYSLGELHVAQQKFDQATEEFAEAARLFAETGNEQGRGLIIRYLAYIDRMNGQYDDATARWNQALDIFQRTGDIVAVAGTLHRIARLKLDLDEIDSARQLLSEALELIRTVRCVRVEAQLLHCIGEADLQAGGLTAAIGRFEEALERVRELADPMGESRVLQGLGLARLRLGEFAAARTALQLSLERAGTSADRVGEGRALLGLAELALETAELAHSVAFAQEASEIFRVMRVPLDQARALTILGQAYTRLGEADAAAVASAEASVLRSKIIPDPSP
jgi:DNA-binding SARP family transcriptional activator/tetratricopeptide (TPR) repeat protein